MGKKLWLGLLLMILVGSIFLVNYLVLKSQQDQEQVNTESENKEAADDKSAEIVTDAGDVIVEGDTRYQTVTYETLFDNSKFHQFKVVISKEEWDGLSEDMLDIQGVDDYMRTTNYRKADLYYTDENGEVFIGEVGFRTKGNTSRVLPEDENGIHRFNFKIKYDETFEMEEMSVAYEYRKQREFAGLEELNFKANNGDDPSNIRELYSYDLISDFGITAPKASMATLTIMIAGVEHDYGVVKYVEPIDKNFLTKRFGKGNNDGNLYKCLWQNYGPASLVPLARSSAIGVKDSSKNYRPTYDLKTNKDEKNVQDLLDFIKNINSLEGEDFKAYIESHFSVDRFIRSQAMDVVLGNIDGYRSMGNNYYLYFNEDGIVEWIPYDYDNILGAGWDGDPYWSYEGIAAADIYEWNNLNAKMYDSDVIHPLFDKIIAIEEYKEKYEEYLATLIEPSNGYFNYDSFMERYQMLYELYGASVDNEMQEGNLWELSNEEWYFNTKNESISGQLGD